MKKILIVSIAILLYGCLSKRAEKECNTFVERPDPHPDTVSWRSTGFNVSFGSTNTRYAKYKEPDVTVTRSQKLYAWRGERVSAQIVVWTSTPLRQIACEVQELKSSGAVIPAGAVEARFVRYTLTDVFGEGCGWRKAEDFPVSLTGDMLDNIECIDMDAKSVRPVWITINVPDSVAAGIYRGNINVYARGKRPATLTVELEVAPEILPPASQWRYHLDLWQHPSAVARTQNLKLWSDEHFNALRPVMKMLAGAGQKVITATLNKDPWNHQCYDAYDDMIRWTKNEDGSWTYDYTVFDQWVDFMINIGIANMINCYSMAPWNNELHYNDAKSGAMITVKADPGTKDFIAMWSPFLKDFVRHLREKKWLEITNIAMDERSPEVMDEILGLLKSVAPELGIALADNHQSYKRYSYIKDLCVAIGSVPDSADLAYRKANGLNTTYYVCCSDSFPNVFTFSDPAEAVYAAWCSKANGFDGFLRWAYNSWVENPELDSRFRTWPSGDTFIVYPEAKSSIRFERLIEGIQDVEKLAILISKLEQQNTPEAKAKLKSIRLTLEQFKSPVKPDNMEAMIENAKMIFR
ncbi:MAG: DUF4091 domain-containing protein [Dysgonamonadaceae bacterium]|jgi:hypothetical protein|nr:DUF4091 domain-containing protein [Dysgonamonadaceae bacterium]